jgi:predicted RecB family nuclease
MTRSLSASRLNDFLGCPHQAALWLSGVAPPQETDPTLELVRTKGFEHEAMVLARLEQEHGPATRITDDASFAQQQADTLAAIKKGAALIYQGALARNRWLGYPDFLVRRPGHDGVFRYEPEDAKLARKAKAEYILQLGIYAELLQALTDDPAANGVIHVAGGPPQSFDLRRTRYILKRLMQTFETFVADKKRSTRPIPCAACEQCDYQPRCEAEWRAADSTFFVAGVSGSQVIKLEEGGVHTLTELASLKPDATIPGIGADTLTRLIAQARLQLNARSDGKHRLEILPVTPGRGFHLLPAPDDGDLFFDMEGDAFYDEGLEYLFGIWGVLAKGGDESFRAFWAHSHVEEKAAFESVMRLFMAHLSHHPNAHIYHYAQYEPNALKRLAMRYATKEAELDQFLRERRFVDLFRVARQSIRASTEGYSLKDLEQIYRGKREGAVTTAAASIIEYERWRVTNDNTILESIARYNQDDCVSTAQMRRWLESMRPPGTAYGIVDDAPQEKTDKSAERRALEARKQALAQRLRASANGDARVRDLVAELLWFHQRAQKPGWWALFEHQSWSDEELVEDPESLGALVLDPGVPPVRDKQSVETTYKFPPQDTKLRIGGSPRIAETLGYAGSIVELQPEDGRVVLRRGVKSGPMPERLSLLPAPISLQGIPDAVLAFADRFAAGDLKADAALMDFLLRRTPRLRGRASGAPLQAEGEAPAAAAVRAVLDLDNSYLFIQGPPGTGKTYTTAEIIALLLRNGHRVGVSSNSHKAINNVLEEVEKRVAMTGQSFAGAKKGSRDDVDSHFDSTHMKTVISSEAVSTAHRLVGGTVFHFCRDDQRQQFDYLIVDEAGQVALGNLLAMAGAARNIVLVGDQMQLPQPVQGVHPGETGFSCLEYLLEDKATVPPDRGILLNESRRLHPNLCKFISEAIYDGRLQAFPATASRFLVLQPDAHAALQPAGLSFVGVAHEGCTQSSLAEAEAIASLVNDLLRHHVQRRVGAIAPLTLNDILIVAPYNMQVNLLKQRLPQDARIGTVDKFQGQEAAVVIVSMTTSRGGDAPRGTDFLFNPNRFNVAVSRAQCLSIVVHGVDLLEGAWPRIEDLQRLNLFAYAEAIANSVPF